MAGEMIFCKACGKEIAKDAKMCPHCGKKNKKSVWIILLIIVGVIIVISAISNLLDKPDSGSSSVSTSGNSSIAGNTVETKTAPSTASNTVETKTVPSAMEVSPFQLFADYEANEVRADNLYKGKLLKITGRIDSIGKDILGDPYITFDSGNIITGVQVSFRKSEQNKLADLSKGQNITIIGTCDGKLMNVFVKNSVIE